MGQNFCFAMENDTPEYRPALLRVTNVLDPIELPKEKTRLIKIHKAVTFRPWLDKLHEHRGQTTSKIIGAYDADQQYGRIIDEKEQDYLKMQKDHNFEHTDVEKFIKLYATTDSSENSNNSSSQFSMKDEKKLISLFLLEGQLMRADSKTPGSHYEGLNKCDKEITKLIEKLKASNQKT